MTQNCNIMLYSLLESSILVLYNLSPGQGKVIGPKVLSITLVSTQGKVPQCALLLYEYVGITTQVKTEVLLEQGTYLVYLTDLKYS